MKHFFLFFIAIIALNSRTTAQSCTEAAQATGGNCASASGTTATNNQTLTTTAYVKDAQHFGSYTINSGGELVICAGGTLNVNNITINGGAIYIHPGGSIIIGNINNQDATITNYGTYTSSSPLLVTNGNEVYNAGIMVVAGLTMESGANAHVTNISVMNLTGNDLNVNADGFLNKGLIIEVATFRINSAGVCLGDSSLLVCDDFNNNSNNAVVIDTGTAGMIVKDQANNNNTVTNDSLFVVWLPNDCGGPGSINWGTADTICRDTLIPAPDANVYYSKSTGSLHDVANWGILPDGNGANPPNFTDSGKLYIITNRSTADITSNWSVGGLGAILAIGAGSTSVHFGINSADFQFYGAATVIMPLSFVSVGASRSVTFADTSVLWIASNATGDGAIGPVNGSVAGLNNQNVIMNKFITDFASRKWSFLASPINAGTIAANWQQQVHVTGPVSTGGAACTNADSASQVTPNTSDGLDPNPSGAYSMYYLDQSVAPNTTGQWKPVTNTIDNTAVFQLNRGNGFRALIRGDRDLGCYLVGTAAFGTTPPRRSVVLRSIGSVPDVTGGIGTFSLPFSTSNGNLYVMVGNPFPCTMNFAAFQSDANNTSVINDKYWLYSPEFASGAYSAYASGVITNRPSVYASDGSQDSLLGSWQSFIVELATAGSGNLSFEETHKFNLGSSTLAGTFKTTATAIPDLLFVGLKDANGGSLDEMAIRFVNDPSVTNTNYSQFDAISLSASSAEYSVQSLKDTRLMSIHARVNTYASDTVALQVKSYKSGTFQFRVSGLETFTNTDIFLWDRLTGVQQHLNINPDYTFAVDLNNSATFGANRFAVIFNKFPSFVADPSGNSYKVYPSPVTTQLNLELPGTQREYTVQMVNITGTTVYSSEMESGANSIDVKHLSGGTYMLKIRDNANGDAQILKIVKF